MAKIKVALFTPSLAGGGAQKAAVYIAQELILKDILVDIVVASPTGELRTSIESSIRVVDLGKKKISRSLPSLILYLRKEKPDVLLSFQTRANLIAILAKFFTSGSKFIIREGNTASINLGQSKNWRDRIQLLLIPIFYPFADAIIAISRGVAEDLERLVKRKKISVIYNPSIPRNLDALINEKITHPFLDNNGSPLIISIGRLVEQKDHAMLIRAICIANKSRPIKLLIIGEGHLKDQLKNLAFELGMQNSIDFTGFVENPFPLLSKSAIFALSSRWEGFGIVLAEALACGTQIVSTDCQSGPQEILEDGKYGRLVPVGNHKRMAAAILNTLENPVSEKELKKRAEMFRVDKIANEYLSLILNLISA